MPELPEVEVTRRGLEPLRGATVTRVVIRQPSMRWPIPSHLPQTLQNIKLLELKRRGKYIIARFESGCLILHLGMSGRLCLLERDTPPEKHDHFDLHFADGRVMRLRDPRRFGAVLWAGEHPEAHSLLSVLGPEPLDESFNGEFLRRAIRTRSSPIKTVIMDSHLVVGVGNIYASESLFRAGIHPQTPARALSLVQCERLVQEIKATLQDALQAGGSSLRDFFGADGNPGYFQQTYFVYARTGEPCRVCKKPVETLRLGQRSTFYCASCQK
ncbi:bifunctional DNA-formamidopyrimidine glycosylase/DNA-(apurinic or apyrimidinic site) lyase [Methylobacillus arboreus]|uniref:bifunctional DNA-formamidopyrimidine glycosylase/DNA-(apurinic or apyrimidinic site) lyase n=1 Tax=Methylobacillus arboreus TaxID=755170 RepID=UPI001E589001|nr:bifunctional DNA-formamidopyrimidine glycosylase/DNA-(apurinic or apyrimidinic site) lyase [Methylobacillus arboreus]MCB5191509.1 bifunctional DNA-formamidopyrimidine glycosylase/DNA-(apurinic or apyrimidinic site) lyase [Methylobacillus arboreus]